MIHCVGRAPPVSSPVDPTTLLLAALCGSIVYRHNVVTGLVRANGRSPSKAAYPELSTYAQGFSPLIKSPTPAFTTMNSDAANFAVPKLDGLFVRGQGQVDANDVSAALGVKPTGVVGPHNRFLDDNGYDSARMAPSIPPVLRVGLIHPGGLHAAAKPINRGGGTGRGPTTWPSCPASSPGRLS